MSTVDKALIIRALKRRLETFWGLDDERVVSNMSAVLKDVEENLLDDGSYPNGWRFQDGGTLYPPHLNLPEK